jgi:hypothetical protein
MKTKKTRNEDNPRKLWLAGDAYMIDEFSDFNVEEVNIFLSEKDAQNYASANHGEESFVIEVVIKSIKRTAKVVTTQDWKI